MANPRIRLKHSTVQDKAPDKAAAVLGELFVNAHEASPGIYSLTTDGEITKLTVYVADDISDVDTTTTAPTSGQALVWDGSNWVPGDVGSAAGLVYKGNIDLTADDPGTGFDVGWLYSNTGTGAVKSTWVGASGTAVTGGELCSYDGTDWNIIDTGSGGGILRIDAGDGIITTPDPLTSAGEVAVNPHGSKGIEISDKKVAVKTGEGIGFDSSGGVAVETGAGLKIDGTDKVAADLGDGLEFDGDDKIKAKVGAGLEIDGSTNIAASVATTSTLGSVIVGTGLSVGTDGTLTADGGASLQPADVKGGDGIAATTGTDDVTLAVDLATGDDGLEIESGKLKASVATAGAIGSVKIGSGIQVTTAGEISVSIPPSETYIGETPPGSPVEGDLWWNSSEDSGRLYVYYDDGATKQWVEAAPQGDTLTESDADTKYLSKVKADTAKGLITFEDVSTHEQGLIADEVSEFKRGLNITGGANDVSNGVSNYSSSKGVKLISDNKDVITARTTGNSGIQLLQEVDSSRTSGSFSSFITNTEIGNMGTQNVTSFRSRVELGGASIGELKLFDTFTTGTPAGVTEITGYSADSTLAKGDINYGFKSNLSSGAADNYNFYAGNSAPSFLAGSAYIGGSVSRNTLDLWKSTLTEEQLETLEAGTLVAPANVSLPGDGSFARQWYYDQQDAETQAELDAGTLEYPTHLTAATFTDTFALGDNTAINLLSNGLGEFSGGVKVTGGTAAAVDFGIRKPPGANDSINLVADGTDVYQSKVTTAGDITSSIGNVAPTPNYGLRLFSTSTESHDNYFGTQARTEGIATTNLASQGIVIRGGDSGLPYTTDNMYGIWLNSNALGTNQSLTNFYGFSVSASSSDVLTIADNNYAFFTNINLTGKNTFAYYAAGNAPNYFAGLVESGGGVKVSGGKASDVDTGMLQAANKSLVLRADGNQALVVSSDNYIGLCGASATAGQSVRLERTNDEANSVGFINISRATSAVTNSQTYYQAILNADANGGTEYIVPEVRLYAATEQSVINADFKATDVYGFYSEISNKSNYTNKFNFYAAGTAPNYFAGSVYIGGATLDPNKMPTGAVSGAGIFGNCNTASQTSPNNAGIFFTTGSSGTWLNNHVLTVFNGAATGGSIRIGTGGDLTFANPSDYRLKTNVQTVTSNISEIIKNVRVVSYNKDGNQIPYGFIAHELQEQIPEAVFGTKDQVEEIGDLINYDGSVIKSEISEFEAEDIGLEYTEDVEVNGVSTATVRSRAWTATGTRPVYQDVDQIKLIPLLTKALQEVLAKNEELETRIAALEGA